MICLCIRPLFLIAKGGITSNDVAVKGLGLKRAMVLGPILPGVPVWECGEESKFPGMKVRSDAQKLIRARAYVSLLTE